MNNVQVIALYILIVLITSFIKHKKVKGIVVALLSLVAIFEVVSLHLTDTFIDYRFYTHFNIESIKDFGSLFGQQIIIFAILYLVSVYLIYKISTFIQKKEIKIMYKLISGLVFVFILWQENGIIKNFINIYKMTHTEEKTFTQSLKALGVDPKEYVLPKDIKATPGKNIIVISVESLEEGFLSEHFDKLAPHLKRYSEEWTFFNNMPVSPGSGWTAGSLFTHQVGLPAFVDMEGASLESTDKPKNTGAWENLLFQGARQSKLIGLGNILKKAGYDYRYLMGNIEFAGIKDLLDSYGYKTISQKNSIGKYKPIQMGLNDLDLFNEAKLQIDDLLKNKNKPFALFMSTINTHFPIGIYDKRMEQYVSKKDHPLLFSVAAVDYLINDFIEYLKSKNLLKNTAIFIFPDHLLMGKDGKVLKKLSMEDRKLYLLTNIKKDKFNKKTSDRIYQVDLPRLIVDGANIHTNAKFFFDLRKVDNKINFIENNNIKMSILNASAIAKKSFNTKVDISLKGNMIHIKSGEEEIVSIIHNKDVLYNYMFSKDMVLLGEKEQSDNNTISMTCFPKSNGDDIFYKLLHLIVKIKDNNLTMVYFGNKQNINLTREPVGNKITFTKKEVENVISSHYKFYRDKD